MKNAVKTDPVRAKAKYHHGDLRRTLVLAAEGLLVNASDFTIEDLELTTTEPLSGGAITLESSAYLGAGDGFRRTEQIVIASLVRTVEDLARYLQRRPLSIQDNERSSTLGADAKPFHGVCE